MSNSDYQARHAKPEATPPPLPRDSLGHYPAEAGTVTDKNGHQHRNPYTSYGSADTILTDKLSTVRPGYCTNCGDRPIWAHELKLCDFCYASWRNQNT